MEVHGERVPGGGGSAICASGIATSAWRCRWPSQLQRITARSWTKRHGDRGRRGQERWRSRTSTKRHDDRRLLHRGSGRSLLRRCPSRRRGSGGTRGLRSTPSCRSWHERTRGRWRRSGSSWLTNAPARPTSGTRSRTPPLGAVRRGRGRRGERKSLLGPLPHAPLLAALVADIGSGVLQAGFLQCTQCSLLTMAGLRCQAYWLVLTRRAGMLRCCGHARRRAGLSSWPVWTRRTVSRFPVVHTSTVCNDMCHGLWGAENCGISAVAVHRRSSLFLSWCRG